MRARLLPLLLVGLLAGLGGAPPADARDPHPKCHPKRSTGLASGGRVRVFRVPNPPIDEYTEGGYRTYACDLLSGRRTLLQSDGHEDESYGIVQARYAGRVVGLHVRSCFRASCSDRVVSLDVVTRRMLHGGVREAPFVPFVVAPTGSIAWVEHGKVHHVSASGGRGELDPGPGVEPGSLALAPDGRLYWTRGGLPRSAPLDPVAPPAERPDPAFGGSRACHPKGSKTLGAGPRARVYEASTSNGNTQLVACNLRTGLRTVFRHVDSVGESHELERVRVAGWFVATAGRGCVNVHCGGGEIVTVDVRSGAIRFLSRRTDGPEDATTDLQLLPDGTAAWILKAGATHRVGVCGPSACETHEDGATEAGSLALSAAGRAYWTGAGGLPRSGERP